MTLQMRRDAILGELIKPDKPLSDIERDVRQLGWDGKYSTVVLTQASVRDVLERYLASSFTSAELELWANLLEGREDIAMDSYVQQVIYQLANPLLEGELSKAVVQSLLAGLRDASKPL